ncbi:DUF2141 domain-containing protein [Balneola sp. MJW-20]|uniref:DUF2141 domain-containing protein n=1 Tax=Gracilimonas aurantiaca TaxID=3234185 RepID=UPI0034662A6B
MTRSLILAAALFCMITPDTLAQEISFPERNKLLNTSSFTLQIEGFKKAEGEVRVAMFSSEETYTKDPVHAVVLPVKDNKVIWTVDDLPFGDYAIAVYHDKNTNGKLDTNFLGIPKEAYGFSNNARGKFGPASWKDASFAVKAENIEHQISIK